jgi:hypothetical protein
MEIAPGVGDWDGKSVPTEPDTVKKNEGKEESTGLKTGDIP